VKLLDVFQATTVKELAERLKELKGAEYTSIQVMEEREYYPASHNQKRLWLLNQGDVLKSTFNMPGIIKLDHQVDVHLVKKALNRVMERHDSFRTGLRLIGNQLVQVVKKEIETPFKMVDLSSLGQPEKENEKQELYSRELAAPFDLNRMPLFKAVLLKLAREEYELLFNMHHILTDGWSMEVLKEEFNRVYDAYKKGTHCDMKPLEVQYKDYVGWQNQLLADGEKMEEAKEFWKGYLEGIYLMIIHNIPAIPTVRPTGG
jgi:hypothetical protein